MNTHQLVKFAKENFQEVNSQLFISYMDNKIVELADIIGIKNELLTAKNNNQDFFTYRIIKETYDVGAIFIFHFGKTSDAGFICFYTPSLVGYKTNILAFLDSIFKQNVNFQRDLILNSLVRSILQELKSFDQFEYRAVRSNEQIYFEIASSSINTYKS